MGCWIVKLCKGVFCAPDFADTKRCWRLVASAVLDYRRGFVSKQAAALSEFVAKPAPCARVAGGARRHRGLPDDPRARGAGGARRHRGFPGRRRDRRHPSELPPAATASGDTPAEQATKEEPLTRPPSFASPAPKKTRRRGPDALG